jgi:hypothetical protein
MRQLGTMGTVFAASLVLALGTLPLAADEAVKTPVVRAPAKAETKGTEAPAKEAKKVQDGKPVFLKYKCTMCHEIASQKIFRTGHTTPDTTWMTTVSRAPDLSGVGYARGEKWIRGWLKKTETIQDRKHLLMFKGTDQELAVLAKWLESLDDERAGKALKEREENLK